MHIFAKTRKQLSITITIILKHEMKKIGTPALGAEVDTFLRGCAQSKSPLS